MKVTWVSAEALMSRAAGRLKPVRSVLDIGCGIQPQQLLKPLVHICCEPFSQYVEKLQEKIAGQHDREYLVVNASWAGAVELFPEKSVDTVFLVDVIEHLEKSEALALLRRTEVIARQQVAVFTPLGFMPQVHADGKDGWGLDGGDWQEHKSGWDPEDFGDGWEVVAAREFHKVDSLNQPLESPYGALWAIKNNDHPTRRVNISCRQKLHAFVDMIYSKLCVVKDKALFWHGKRF